jgi:hypothetical protein
MRWLSTDQTSQCKHFVGIITDDPSKPAFLFSRTDGGAWMFKAASKPKYKNDGNTVIYPISTLIDSSSNRAFDLPGECTINAVEQPTISCILWSQGGSKMNEVVFNGNGTWAFSRK